jgi:hypothetical protein
MKDEMKDEIEVRHKGKVVNIIKRVIEHQGQYIGPLFCRYNGKRVEVKFEGKGPFFIEE